MIAVCPNNQLLAQLPKLAKLQLFCGAIFLKIGQSDLFINKNNRNTIEILYIYKDL